jgi:hypothetical protein
LGKVKAGATGYGYVTGLQPSKEHHSRLPGDEGHFHITWFVNNQNVMKFSQAISWVKWLSSEKTNVSKTIMT